MSQQKGPLRIVAFEDGRYEAFFEDGGILAWKQTKILYFTPKGLQSRLALEDAVHSEDLMRKLQQILKVINLHSDFQLEWDAVKPQGVEFKEHNIKYFYWEQSRVVKLSDGAYRINSIDGLASLTLGSDLYSVHVNYLQQISTSEVRTREAKAPIDLIAKYSPQFRASSSLETFIMHGYKRTSRFFTIFSLPKRWYAPLARIYEHIFQTKSKEDVSFLYIDFQDNQVVPETKMPPLKQLGKRGHDDPLEQGDSVFLTLPIYGKPNTSTRFIWLYIRTKEGQTLHGWGETPILADGEGYWFLEQSNYLYRQTNKQEADGKYHYASLPYVIRMPGCSDKHIHSQLEAWRNYVLHRDFLQEQENIMKPKVKQLEDLIDEGQLNGVCKYKVYANGTTVGRFGDRTFIKLRGFEVTVLSPEGEEYVLDLSSNYAFSSQGYRRFKGHIQLLKDKAEELLCPEEWNQRQLLNQHLSAVTTANEAFLKVCASRTKEQ